MIDELHNYTIDNSKKWSFEADADCNSARCK